MTPSANRFRDALYHYTAEVRRIIDGDTIEVALSLGCRVYVVRRTRLIGYNAPELYSGVNRNAGVAARVALSEIIPVGATVFIATQLDRESFDRLLGRVYAVGEGDALVDVAQAMVNSGHGTVA